MSGEEFAVWRAFDWLAPLGAERDDRHAALIASVLANVNRGPNQDPYSLDDFDLYRERKRLTRAEEEARFRDAFMSKGLVRTAEN